MVKELTIKELNKLIQIIKTAEEDIFYPYSCISGGFSNCKLRDFDNDHIYIDVEYGVNDTGDGGTVHTDTITLNRKTMKAID